MAKPYPEHYPDASALVLFRSVGEWAHDQFPKWSTAGILAHIGRELEELRANPVDGEEMADIIILLCHLAREYQVNLAYEVARKLAINKARTWREPDADGVIEHER